MKLGEKVFKINVTSDSTILIVFDAVIDPEINGKVHALCQVLGDYIKNSSFDGILDLTPTYHTLQITYDALGIDPFDFIKKIELVMKEIQYVNEQEKEIIEVPVCYEAPYAPDIDEVCGVHKINKEELIKRHTSRDYLIYMMGFTPGFPYLGGMDKSIATPRRPEPRLKIDAGSVGIAGEQTGVYPVDSPGGWQIIGRTPLNLFDVNKDQPFLLKEGQYVRFKAISVQAYERLKDHGKT